MTPDLSVTLGRLKMKNPVTVASGTFGYGREYAELIDVAKLGAVTVKGLRTDPCDGNPTPRIAEVRAGLLNAIGRWLAQELDPFQTQFLRYLAGIVELLLAEPDQRMHVAPLVGAQRIYALSLGIADEAVAALGGRAHAVAGCGAAMFFTSYVGLRPMPS